MLWEVERILTECYELGTLPQILLMENVPQIHQSGENAKNFHKWQVRLEELGYKNYMQDLIATDYGIPQTRNRCFMVSILGDYSYTFPKPIPLKLKLKDILEDNVDEKYYLSDKQIKDIQSWNAYEKPLETLDKDISKTLTTRSGDYTSSMQLVRDNLKIKNATKIGYLEATDGDGIDISSRMEHHRGTVQKDKSQTLTTQCDVGVCVGTYQYAKSDNFMQGRDRLQLGKETSDTLQTTPKEGIVYKPKVLGGIGEKDSNNNTQWKQQNRIYDENCAISVTTAFNPYYKTDLRIRKLTPRECGRLQGVKDSDITKLLSNQSDSSAYHCFGDAITVPVLCAIFGELLGINYKKLIERWNYNE